MNTLRASKPFLAQKMGVKSIGLFGSYARGEARPDSDIDILVEMERPDFSTYMDIQFYLEETLNAQVDLLRLGPHLRPAFLKTITTDMIYA